MILNERFFLLFFIFGTTIATKIIRNRIGSDPTEPNYVIGGHFVCNLVKIEIKQRSHKSKINCYCWRTR